MVSGTGTAIGAGTGSGLGSGVVDGGGVGGGGGDSDISEIDRRILALQDYLENARYSKYSMLFYAVHSTCTTVYSAVLCCAILCSIVQ